MYLLPQPAGMASWYVIMCFLLHLHSVNTVQVCSLGMVCIDSGGHRSSATSVDSEVRAGLALPPSWPAWDLSESWAGTPGALSPALCSVLSLPQLFLPGPARGCFPWDRTVCEVGVQEEEHTEEQN